MLDLGAGCGLLSLLAARAAADAGLHATVYAVERHAGLAALAVSTLESNMIIYDMRTYHPEEGYAGRTQKVTKSTVWGCHFVPQNRELFATVGGKKRQRSPSARGW